MILQARDRCSAFGEGERDCNSINYTMCMVIAISSYQIMAVGIQISMIPAVIPPIKDPAMVAASELDPESSSWSVVVSVTHSSMPHTSSTTAVSIPTARVGLGVFAAQFSTISTRVVAVVSPVVEEYTIVVIKVKSSPPLGEHLR